jgi:RimJ/RimL family protein N-acetyltransferase
METCTPDVQSGATPPQPPYQIEAVALEDGTVVAVRPVAPDDAARIDAFVDALSEESAHRRFLGAKRRLTRKEIRYLTEVDHRDHEALVALDRSTGAPLGVARYIRAADRPDTAELAVVVGDAWQGRGLGRAMVARLADRARANGIRRGRAVVLAQNARALRLLDTIGDRHTSRNGHVLEVDVELAA